MGDMRTGQKVFAGTMRLPVVAVVRASDAVLFAAIGAEVTEIPPAVFTSTSQ